MAEKPLFIPRPLVRVNQWIILLSTIATWVFQQPLILLIPLIANLMGLFFNFNPFMKLARLFLKKKPSEYIPEDVVQQKFNSCIAITCLLLGFIGFELDKPVMGYIFTIMVAAASGIAILGFCIGCFIFFQLKQLRYKLRKSTHA
ncbi:DUF4395 domain-containing protein [Rummeliibacillus suwonensis]|jgi:hypothetical protein|uniref:DUF4395 domain-containing protein n=1 Tax=Rummeliibacillus suwonensis TaxID=1306154 RepID=UPI0011B6E1A1|nr:DUF4395 domain-containing protein [Rummeliibacillus suwonensis]MBO2536223.1 DUF4395 domain-containing protein [Rummeliibacillus suwonensis]